MTKILDKVHRPHDLKKLSIKELQALAVEIRHLIIDTVAKTGGHLASNLGTIELTLALHYCLDMPQDVILFDVGHQAYTHKIITGRKNDFTTLRQPGGLSGFPDIDENPTYDYFTVGHSSTSISWALGLACARDIKNREIKKLEERKIAVVIGDASLANGMAFEALNHTGHLNKKLMVILNDNEHSISPSIGALSSYLNRIVSSPLYNRIRQDVEKLLKRVPWFGFRTLRAAKQLEMGLIKMLVPGLWFEELGFRYFGPMNGQDIPAMIEMFKNVSDLDEPVLIHLLTKKGKGYEHAENAPSKFHSAGKFEICSGIMKKSTGQSYTEVFQDKMLELGEKNEKIVAITAAMPGGTGFEAFGEKYPERFFDTGIAEEHAVGFAAGLARGGFKPVVAIYSTFLQRSFDQIIHDVCLQKLPVVFAIDRAGIVPDDGPTHNGVFDIAYLRLIPNMVVMAPSDKDEFERLLTLAMSLKPPCAIRYPKDCVPDMGLKKSSSFIPLGKSRIIREGKDVSIFALGSMVALAFEAAKILETQDIYAEVVDARFVKPLDEDLIRQKASEFKAIITVEDGVISGGFGSAVSEFIQNNLTDHCAIKMLGLPDKFLKHGKRGQLLSQCGLSAQGIADSVKQFYTALIIK
ncbi:MAG: 1-deoxy-D-xylulose-5-phosphate synthase [Candidatus Omnitrophica bacterium]|nr:1-deoxy-D-xylulose-5-phosphate synthase [Candidatus Omnitrophota bacterium]